MEGKRTPCLDSERVHYRDDPADDESDGAHPIAPGSHSHLPHGIRDLRGGGGDLSHVSQPSGDLPEMAGSEAKGQWQLLAGSACE